MILYHGSAHAFEWPDYATIVELTSDIEHPRGLHVSTSIEEARSFGENVYEVVIDTEATICRDPALLQEPRHKLFMRDCAVVLDDQSGQGVVVDFEVIEDFGPI